eukprot:gnl/TRDRNA2_/TRDRNA2_34054_c0_seq1.p1 gnl/TRDRNA2_/TRDRNA2_34054_c0~~gnl/TRDRNA2_/TRDRNA2_34054_c0_seq1.p1  ORF type:complete len:104 (+),score=9.93 gnl/TRDRNA2_/TRDRNA2_34054_c0_seq1:24-314(+)
MLEQDLLAKCSSPGSAKCLTICWGSQFVHPSLHHVPRAGIMITAGQCCSLHRVQLDNFNVSQLATARVARKKKENRNDEGRDHRQQFIATECLDSG